MTSKNLNPLPYIEKWISEHGSAAILRDHVALLKSQMETLETEIGRLKSDNAVLKSERDGFKAKFEKAQVELDKLKLPSENSCMSAPIIGEVDLSTD